MENSVKQYILYCVKDKDPRVIAEAINKMTNIINYRLCNLRSPISEYHKHDTTYRMFQDVEPNSNIQQWLVDGMPSEIFEFHSELEMLSLDRALDESNVLYEFASGSDITLIITEPISVDDYFRAIESAQKKSLFDI